MNEQHPGVWAITAASDPANGLLLGIMQFGNYWAKEGSLNAGWVFQKGPLHPDI